MMHELEAPLYERARPLLANVDHHLSATAVVDGTCPGRIWVDDADTPRTALLSTPEAHVLAGQRPDADCAKALRRLITDVVYPKGRDEGWWFFDLSYPDESWQAMVADVVGVKYPVWTSRQYFVLRRLQVDWRQGLPQGFAMTRVDEDLLKQARLANAQRVQGWASNNFGSIPQFLKHGFGFCLVHDDQIVSWCMSDCVSGCRCEIGIHTAEAYRRRGFAVRTVAAAVEHCLATGLTHVGWHCSSTNSGSAATARAVGFEKARDLHAVQVWFNEFDSLLVNGNLCLLRDAQAEAAEWYERAFAEMEAGSADALASYLVTCGADRSRYYYKASCAHALAGDRTAAARNLSKAVDAGTDRWRLF